MWMHCKSSTICEWYKKMSNKKKKKKNKWIQMIWRFHEIS